MSILIENVTKHFGENIVLDGINLEIKTGSLVALLGGSGSGKSTLLRVVAGFEEPSTGRVWLNGKDSSSLSIQEKEIGFVFQAYALFQHLTVYENIAFGLSCNNFFERGFFRNSLSSWFSKSSFFVPNWNRTVIAPSQHKYNTKNQSDKQNFNLTHKLPNLEQNFSYSISQEKEKQNIRNVSDVLKLTDKKKQTPALKRPAQQEKLKKKAKTNSFSLEQVLPSFITPKIVSNKDINDLLAQHSTTSHLLRNSSSSSTLRSVEELLRLVGLENLAHRYPNQLSGGQCQRVALARALAVQPKVLLLDEPFGALDTKVRKNLRRWLRQLHERVGVTTLFVTHDHQEAMEVANEIVVLDKGRVKHSLNSPQKIFSRLTST